MILLIAFVGGIALALAILLLGGAERRGRRLKRVFGAAGVFVIGNILSTLIAVARGTAIDAPGFWLLSLAGWAVTLAVTAVPFALADRVAGLFGAARTIAWAVLGVAVGLAWSATITFLILRYPVHSLSWHGLLLDLALPGIVAGLAWYIGLPRAEPVGEVFD